MTLGADRRRWSRSRSGRASSSPGSRATGAGHVQSLILGAVLFNAAVVLAALGIIGDLLSGQRIMLQRIFERVRRLELHAEIPPSHYEPGGRADTASRPPPARTRAAKPHRRARGRPAVSTHRHPRRRGHGHRQHLRQVRVLEPGRQEADGGLRAHAGRAVGEGLAALACSTSAAARACSRTSGRSACATAASSASTSRTRRSRPSGPSARRRTSSTRS